jgi:hypothetical protein
MSHIQKIGVKFSFTIDKQSDMIRRKFLAISGLFLSSGCLPELEDSKDSEFLISNKRDSELDVSIRLKDGERGFAVEGFMLDSGETGQFAAGFVGVAKNMTVVAKILSPQEATYQQKEIPVGIPEYDIRIQPNSISVVWVAH